MSGLHPALREQLAAIEHQRWADWQRWMHGRLDGLTISREDWDRWEAQIATPYADLTEAEKNSDREQVDRYLPLIDAELQAAYDQGAADALREAVKRLGPEA